MSQPKMPRKAKDKFVRYLVNNPTSLLIMGVIADASESKDIRVTEATWLAEASGYPRNTLTQVMRALAEASDGEYKFGRRGKDTRVVWAFPMTDLQDAVREARTAMKDGEDSAWARGKDEVPLESTGRKAYVPRGLKRSEILDLHRWLGDLLAQA